MITKRQKLILLYFSVRALTMGIGLPIIIRSTKQDAWISCILGLFVGLLFMSLVVNIQKYKKDDKLDDIFRTNSFGNFIVKSLILIFCLLIMYVCLMTVINYVTNFYLIKTPIILIIIPWILLIFLVCSKGFSVIARVSECLFPISILTLIFSLLALVPMIEFNNFLPIFESGSFDIILLALQIAIISAGPTLLLINTSGTGEKYYSTYAFAFFGVIAIIICTIGILGSTLSSIYQFPEYMVLKKIMLFDFLEKIENIVALSWILDLFILMSLATIFIKTIVLERKNNIFLIATLVILGIAVYLSADFSFLYTFLLKNYLANILLILFCSIALFIIIFIHNKKHKNI